MSAIWECSSAPVQPLTSQIPVSESLVPHVDVYSCTAPEAQLERKNSYYGIVTELVKGANEVLDKYDIDLAVDGSEDPEEIVQTIGKLVQGSSCRTVCNFASDLVLLIRTAVHESKKDPAKSTFSLPSLVLPHSRRHSSFPHADTRRSLTNSVISTERRLTSTSGEASIRSDRRTSVVECALFRITDNTSPFLSISARSIPTNATNNFTLLSRIGSGTYGVVYLAKDEQTNEVRAIKRIARSTAQKAVEGQPAQNLSDRSVAKREVDILKQLQHRHVVRLYQVLDNPSLSDIYLVMEHAEHGSISKIRFNGTYPTVHEPRLRRIMRQVTSGILYIHKHNVIHRDIKPENILLRRNDNVALTDFGISERVIAGRIDGVQGSPAFVAPELQTNASSSVDGTAVDVWALGVTFFVLKFGYFPFDGPPGTAESDASAGEIIFLPNTPIQWVLFFRWILNPIPQLRMTLRELRTHDVLKWSVPSEKTKLIVAEFVAKIRQDLHSRQPNSLSTSMEVDPLCWTGNGEDARTALAQRGSVSDHRLSATVNTADSFDVKTRSHRPSQTIMASFETIPDLLIAPQKIQLPRRLRPFLVPSESNTSIGSSQDKDKEKKPTPKSLPYILHRSVKPQASTPPPTLFSTIGTQDLLHQQLLPAMQKSSSRASNGVYARIYLPFRSPQV